MLNIGVLWLAESGAIVLEIERKWRGAVTACPRTSEGVRESGGGGVMVGQILPAFLRAVSDFLPLGVPQPPPRLPLDLWGFGCLLERFCLFIYFSILFLFCKDEPYLSKRRQLNLE